MSIDLPDDTSVSEGDVIIIENKAYKLSSVSSPILLQPEGWGGPLKDKKFSTEEDLKEFLEEQSYSVEK